MEDGGNGEPAKPAAPKLSGKAGWMKKSSGKFLSSYKDRYVQLERTEVVVYDNEDLKKCLERVDLENYDMCHELRSAFKKKNRLVLIRSPKRGSKVQDVKFQAENTEEKEAWIKALTDGINKAKNKIFDEVKVDDSCSLDHVTRSRPKGNRSRRPPTRIHMKEVASVSSDGILRLDLDVMDATPNGMQPPTADEVEDKKAMKPPMPPAKQEAIPEEPEEPQKKIIKPPMPPSKDLKPSGESEEELTSVETQEKKVLKPPMPPSKVEPPLSTAAEDENGAENASDSGVESGAPPTPNKPSLPQSEADRTDSPSTPPTTSKISKPPTPPSKLTKPTEPAAKQDEDAPEDEEEGSTTVSDEEENVNEEGEVVQINHEEGERAVTPLPPSSALKPCSVQWDTSSLGSDDLSPEQDDEESSASAPGEEEVTPPSAPAAELTVTPVATPEPDRKSPGPPAPPKKKLLKTPGRERESAQVDDAVKASSESQPFTNITQPAAPEEAGEEEEEEEEAQQQTPAEPQKESETVALPLKNGEGGAMPCDTAMDQVDPEEKSTDSGQHSAEESESGDPITSSTAASEDDMDPTDRQAQKRTEEEPLENQTGTTGSPQGSSLNTPSTDRKHPKHNPRPPVPLKPSIKARSVSVGDLLSEPSESRKRPIEELPLSSPGSDMMDLQNKVSLEMEKTGKLLGAIATSTPVGTEQKSGPLPELLLTTAMETLRKADLFLREAKSFTLGKQDREAKRISW